MVDWDKIENAPKGNQLAIEVVILGYAPDEEGYSPPSREGFWSWSNKEWRFTSDPTWRNPPQPTHWMPMPKPPEFL